VDGVLIFAFIGGAVATVNPCGFALLPAYLARRINTKPGNGNVDVILRAIGVGAMTSSGFVIVFGIVGTTISLGAYWVVKYMPWAGFIIGIALVLAGLFVLSGKTIPLRLPVSDGQTAPHSWTGDLLFGIGYGTASLSCTLPIFLAVTGIAVTGSLAASALTFTVYALGMGTVLMTLAIAAALARQGIAVWMRKVSFYAPFISGGVMVLSGIYVTFYWGIILFLPDMPGATKFITYGDLIAGPIRKWLGGQSGAMTLLSLALLIALFLAWAFLARFTRKPKMKKPHKTTLPI
jgi:cytochrome c-type biogenesis protein